MAEQSRERMREKLKESALKQQLSSESKLLSTHYEPELTPKQPCSVFVGAKQRKSFPESITKRHLHNHLASFSSDILNVTVARGARDSRFGIVTFTSKAVAKKAIQEFDGSMLLEEFCLYLNFFGEKKTSCPVTASAAPKKKPSQQVKPTQGPIACTEAKGTTALSASLTPKSNVPLSSHVIETRPKYRRGRHRKSCSESASSATDEVSPPKDHPPVESPLVPSVPCLLESSSQLSSSDTCNPALETASSEPLPPSSPAIVMKCLSSLVTEEEIKALLLRYGFEMVSCKLYSGTEADSGTTNALVHLNEFCHVSKAVKKLNGLSILGEHICVVPFQASTFNTPTIQASLISTAQVGLGSKVATQKESSSKADDRVDASKALATQSTGNSISVPLMLRAKQIVYMSVHLYSFFMKQFPEDVTHLQERGGKVSYLKGQMVAQAPTKDILSRFIKEVGKAGEMKRYLSIDQWNSIMTTGCDGDSHVLLELKTVLGSGLSAEVHPSLSEHKALLVVGVTEELVKAGNRLDDFLTKQLPLMCLNMKTLHMNAIFCTLPNLTEDIFQQYGVSTDGFNTKSTCLILRGPPAMILPARTDIIDKASNILIKKVEFPHPHILIRSLQKRLNGSQAFVLSPDGGASTVIHAPPSKVHICSLSKDSLEAACQVLREDLIEDHVVLALSYPEVTTACTELQKEVVFVMKVLERSQNSTSLLIQGYVLEDVKLACKRLHIEFSPVKRHVLGLTSLHVAYLRILLLDSTSQQGEGDQLCQLLHELNVRMEFECEAGMQKVHLTGANQTIDKAVNHIFDVLHNLDCREFLYSCDLCFLEQIKKEVLNPIRVQKVIHYYIDEAPKHKVATDGTPASFSISIFSKNSNSFREICEAMEAICPYSSSYFIHPDTLILQKKSLNDVASKHSAKIELVSEPKPLLRIHALCERNAVSCWVEMNKFIASAIKTTEEVRVNVYKARYIQIKHAEEIAEFGQQCDIQLPQLSHKVHSATLLSIHIKGNIGIVNKACKRIKEVSEQCKVTKVTLQCPSKYIPMWRKRWEEFQDEQEEHYDLMIEFNCQPPSCIRRGSDQPQPDCNATLAKFVIFGHDHRGIEVTEQLLLERENGKLLAECVFQLNERKQIEILQTGLQMKKLVDPHIKYSICMSIDKVTGVVKLTAPVAWKSRLLDAKEEILQFIGDKTQVKYEFICDDHVVGLILTSQSFEFCNQLQKVAKDSNISIQPFRKPHPGFKLWGLEASIEQFKSKANALISSHIKPMIGSNQLQVSAMELDALSSDAFHHLESGLQEELCVVCLHPNKRVGKDEACSLSDVSELSDQEDTSPLVEGKGKHWFWVDDNGQFVPYPSEVSDALTAMHIRCSTDKYKWVCPDNGNQYYIDLTRMEQRNIVTGVARKVSLQPAKQHWYYLDVYGVDHSYDDVLSNQLERSYCQGKIRYVNGIYSFDLKLMVMMKPMERPIMREIKATPAHVPQDKKEKSKAVTKMASFIIRGPEQNLEQAQLQIRRELSKTVITKDLELPFHSTIDFEQSLKKIANDSKRVSISITAKAVASSAQVKVIRIKGLQQSVDAMVIKIQGEIIKFQSLKSSEPQDTPPEWEVQDRTMQLFHVKYNSSEWCHVTGLFKQTLPTATVLSIKRIQNTWVWRKYAHHRAMLHQKYAGKVNERELFHGTSYTDSGKIVDSEEGFDARFSSYGLWGQANYFAVNSSYSNVYAHIRHNGEKEMLLAKVLTGASVKCEPDRTLRMPPLMNEASGGIGLQQQRYDTVCGTTQGSVVYMTYSNEKAYPAYLIRYQDNVHHSSYYGAQPGSRYAHSSVSLYQHAGTSQPLTSSSHASPSSAYLTSLTPQSQQSQATGTQPRSSPPTGTRFQSSQATGTQFPSSQATGTRFQSSQATGTRFQSSQATGTRFQSSQATGTRFQSPQATGTRFQSSQATGTQFPSPQATGTQFPSPQATGAQYQSSQATGTQFQSSQATGAQSRSTSVDSVQSRQSQGSSGSQQSSSEANNCVIL